MRSMRRTPLCWLSPVPMRTRDIMSRSVYGELRALSPDEVHAGQSGHALLRSHRTRSNFWNRSFTAALSARGTGLGNANR
jgi:hypothetical protein